MECLMAFKFFQAKPNTIKQGVKLGNSVGKNMVFVIVFGHRIFPVWTGLKPFICFFVQ